MPAKQQILKSFNASAYSYNSAATIQSRVALQLRDFLQDCDAKSILEIGCGTGLFSTYLQQDFPNAKLLLTDFAPAMLEICRAALPPSGNIAFKQMDGELLTLSTSYDLIASSMTMHWFSDIKKSLQEIITRLTPGGKLVFAMMGENSLQEWRDICKIYRVAMTPAFVSKDYLRTSFPEMQLHVETVRQPYSNTYEFLKTLKSIGADTPRAAHFSLTAGKLRHLMRLLDKKNPQDVMISYEIIYGSYKKQ
jgi:malonyl-CoA O-methyltransferase